MVEAAARTLATARLRIAIRDAGLTREEAAALLGKDARQVRRWLSGRVSLGPLELLCAIDSGAPARPAMDAEVLGLCTGSRASRGDDGGKTPLSGAMGIQHSENAGTETLPKLSDDLGRHSASLVRTGESRRRDFAGGRETSCSLVAARAAHLTSGPTGFDTERESDAIVPAVSVRCEQLANPNCERQRGFRPSHRGLIGVDEQGARVAHRRKHTSSAETDCRVPAQIQTVVEAPTPLVPKAVDCLEFDYARERTSEANFVDPGSTPGGSTTDALGAPSANRRAA